MNSEKFTTIVKYPEVLASTDITALSDLSKSYPYSQVIHSLLAKAHFNAGSPETRQTIGVAAIHATNRQALKDYVTNIQSHTTFPEHREEAPLHTHFPRIDFGTTSTKENYLYDDDYFRASAMLREEVKTHLDMLLSSKQHYNIALQQFEEEASKKEKPAPRRRSATKTTATAAKKKTTTRKAADNGATKKNEAGDELAAATENSLKTTTKKKEGLKANDQKKIIDKFIKNEPRISAKQASPFAAPAKDLSEGTTKPADDLISENLASILIDQGKKEKAVEMYKKLIWKFPQKKSYFVALIEKLT